MVVVTRHKGLVNFLITKGLIAEGDEVVEHASVEDVKGKHTIGVLPMHLAAETKSHTEVKINYPREYRGEELTESQVEKYATEIVEYSVTANKTVKLA